MLQLEVLVLEFVTVDYVRFSMSTGQHISQIRTGLSTSAVTPGEITSLDHEAFDDPMEGRLLITKALLPRRQGAEVFNGLRDCSAVKTHHDAAHRLIAVADVEIDLVGNLWAFNRLRCLGEEEEGDGED